MATERKPSPVPVIFAIGLFCYFVLLACLDIARFYGLKSNIADIGVFDQTFWLMLHHGHPFATTSHFYSILYAFAPFYALAPYPETLQIINAALLTIAAIPIYLTARHWQVSPWLALAWAGAYMFNPFTLNAGVWDLREVAVATPIIGFALYAIARHHKIWLVILLSLLLLCKEHYGLNVAGFGLLWVILYREWRFGLTISAIGLLAVPVTLLVVMPYLNEHPFMDTSFNLPQAHFNWIMHIGSQSGQFLVITALTALLYMAMLLAPFWLLPLYAFIWILPAGGDLAINALSSSGYIRSVFACHSAPIIPVMAIAAMRAGLALSRKRPATKFSEITLLVLISSMAFGYANAPAPLPGAQNIWEIDLHDLPNPNREDIQRLRDMFPPEKKVCAQSNIGGFFSGRPDIHFFPFHLNRCDTVILHPAYPFSRLRDLFDAPYLLSAPDYTAAVRKLLQDKQWGITYWHNGWLALERGKPGIPADPAQIEAALVGVEQAYERIGGK